MPPCLPPLAIVFFVRRFRPDVGGVEKYIQELAHALVDLGHCVTVIAGDPAGTRPRRETLEGVEVRRYPSRRSPLRAFVHLAGLRHVIRAADVFHVSDVSMLEYYRRMIGWLVGRRPICLTRHGMSGRDPIPAREIIRSARARARVAAMFDDGAFIQRRLGSTPDLVPDPGLRPEPQRVRQTPEPLPDSAVFIGRLECDCGIDLYLDALAVLRDEYGLHLRLDVYGDGGLRPDMQRRADREELNVHWHGAQADAQQRLHDACFAFVSGRMAIMEAMARRRVVVAACVDPLKRDYVCGEWFSDLLAIGRSGRELAEVVARLAGDTTARRELTERAFQRVSGLSWRRTAEAYLSVWRRHLMQPQRVHSWTWRSFMEKDRLRVPTA